MRLDVDQAKEVIIDFCQTYPVAAGLGFHVRATQEELFHEQATVEKAGRIFAAYFPRQHYVAVASTAHRDTESLERTLRHEILGHFGLNTFDAREKRAVLTAIVNGREQPGLKSVWVGVERGYPQLTPLRQAEEVFASLCEAIDSDTRVNDVRGQLVFMETVLVKTRPMTATDLGTIAGWVATGMKDRTRVQRTFPADDIEQFKQAPPPVADDSRRRSAVMDKKPFHEAVAEKLIAQLQAGTAPWQRPWKPGEPNQYLPYNPTTGNRYKGINSIVLLSGDHEDRRWMTYNQAAAQGAQVRRGEKGTAIQYWKFDEERVVKDGQGNPVLDAQGQPRKMTVKLDRPRMFTAVVFNAEQIDGLPAVEQKEIDWVPSVRAESILSASGATIRHDSSGAFYRLATDSVHMPSRESFPTADGYYATALHELGHWTGHPSRLDRDLAHPFGSEGYAREELRAEIASMLLGDELGIGHDPGQHAAYVKSWIKALEDDPMEIFRASADAEKIQAFVLAQEQQQTVHQTPSVGAAQSTPANAHSVSPNPSLAQQLVDVQTQLQRTVRHLDGLRPPEDYAATVALAERAIGTRTVTVTGSDPNARAIDRLPEDHQRLALGVARDLANITASWLNVTAGQFGPAELAEAVERNPFTDDRLFAAFEREIRYVSQHADQLLTSSLESPAMSLSTSAPEIGALDALHDRMMEADALYQRELERAYGVDAAGDARYQAQHNDPAVQDARDAFHAAGDAWHDALTVTRQRSAAAEPPAPQNAEWTAEVRPAEQSIHNQLDAAMPEYESLRAIRKAAEERFYAAELALVDAGTADVGPDVKAALVAERKADFSDVQTQVHAATAALDDYVQANPVVTALHILQEHVDRFGSLSNYLEADEAEQVMRDGMLDTDMDLADVSKEDREITERWLILRGKEAAESVLQQPNELQRLLDRRAELRQAHAAADATRAPAAGQALQAFLDQPTPDAALAQRFHQTLALETRLDNALTAVSVESHPGLAAAAIGELASAHGELSAQATVEHLAVAQFPALATAQTLLDQPQNAALRDAVVATPAPQVLPATSAAVNESNRSQRGPQQGWLAVPFKEKEEAKRIGAAWDKTAKCWFAREGADMAKLAKWLPTNTQSLPERPQSPADEFRQSMKDYGLETTHRGIEHPIADGKRHRVPVTTSNKKGNLDGFYVFHDDGHPAGFIMNNHSGKSEKWVAKGYHLSDEQRAKLAAETAEKLQRRETEQLQAMERTAERVQRQMDDLVPLSAGEETPYLERKGVTGAAGVFTDKERSATYVPVIDIDNKQWSMQYIQPDGTKRFAKDGRKEGCFHAIGGLDALAAAPALVVGEGYATARTVGDALGFATVAAFDSGNLPAVVKALVSAYPDKPVIVVGDDDKAQELKNGKNPGREKAMEAVESVGGIAVFPIFAPGEQAANPGDFSDFNDLGTRSTLGADAVRRQIEPVVQEAVERREQARELVKGQAQEQSPNDQAPRRRMKA